MQERSRRKEKIELAEPAGNRFAPGHVLDAIQNRLNRRLRRSGPEDDFVGFLESETDNVAILQNVMIHFIPVHVDAPAVAAVFETVAAILANDCGALAGNAGVGKLEVIPGLAAAD
jgi:hypothetical protein